MFDFKSATQWDKDVLLARFMHGLSWEARQVLMRELPETYNRICGRDIVKTVRVHPINDSVEI